MRSRTKRCGLALAMSLLLVAAGSPTAFALDGQQEEPELMAQADAIATGEWGTCSWER